MKNQKLAVYKAVLSNVRFDFQLFEKELVKAMRHIEPTHLTEFRDWCVQTFPKYKDIIQENYIGFSQGHYYKIHQPATTIRFSALNVD